MQRICVGALLVRRDEGLCILPGRREVERCRQPGAIDGGTHIITVE